MSSVKTAGKIFDPGMPGFQKIYNGIPNYIKSDMDKSRFGSILVDKIASSIIEAPNNRFFLDRIIYKGKILLLKMLQ